MAEKKTKKASKIRKIKLSDRQKAIIQYLSAGVLGICTVLAALSLVSYFFTWQQDVSALNDPTMMDVDKAISNWGGKAGFYLANLLVGRLLGAAGLCFLVFLAAATVKLWDPQKCRFLRCTLLTLTGAYVLAVTLSYLGQLLGIEAWLPNGLGGMSGSATVVFLENLVKPVVTGLILLFFIVLWMIIARPSFFNWLGSLQFRLPSFAKKTAGEPSEEVFEDDIPEEESVEEESQPEESLEEPSLPEESFEEPSLPEESTEEENNLEITVDRGPTYVTDVTEDLQRDIDYKDKMSKFVFPSLDLLRDYAANQHEVSQAEIDRISTQIKNAFSSFNIEVVGVHAIPGPTVTLYKLTLGAGVKLSQVKKLQEDIGIFLGFDNVRVVKLSDSVGIEVENSRPSIVPLKSMLADDSFRNSKAELPIAIGYTISREVRTFDLAEAPHLLLAGATKMGKSVGLNVIINSLLYAKHPSELKFVFVDPKMVEFSPYAPILNHYMAVLPNMQTEQEMRDRAIITTPEDTDKVLKSLVVEMEERYRLMRLATVNQIKLYNEKYIKRFLNPEDGHKYFPYLVAIIDEFADLTMAGGYDSEGKACARRINNAIIRLAQKGRAAGIHVILATQRPSADVVTSLIKANFPMRIAFRVVSYGDSTTILGSTGAEKLIGKGDMLLYNGASDTKRIQCAYISGEEISAVAKHIGNQTGYKQVSTPYFLPEPPDEAPNTSGVEGTVADVGKLDARFAEAARYVVEVGRASTTLVQRRLGVGYAKAARIMDQLEAHGIVGPQDGAHPRDVLISDFQTLQSILDAIS